jgi:plasmid stabilization system protein ParE
MARRTVEFRPEARDELYEASDYYRERNPQAADNFEAAIAVLIERMRQHPEQFALVEPPIRFALVRRFPYYLPFREVGDTIEVLGVCHASRRPKYWKKREG